MTTTVAPRFDETGLPADGDTAGDAGIEGPDGRDALDAYILSVDGAPVQRVGQLQALMTEARIGRKVHLTVWRDGRNVDVVVVPEELSV